MRYQIDNKVLTFYLENPKRAKESTRTDSFSGTFLTAEDLTPMLDALVRKFRGLSLSSKCSMHGFFVRPLLTLIKLTGSHWPKRSIEWQLLVAQFFQFYLTDTRWSKAKTSARILKWKKNICPTLEFLKNEEIIPLDVVIPSILEKKLQSITSNQPILGQTNPRPLKSKDPVKKLLVDIDFGMTDADYLDSVEKKCRSLVDVVGEACTTHWDGLMKDMESGRQLAAQVSDDNIAKAIANGQYSSLEKFGEAKSSVRSTRYPSTNDPQGVNWALAIVRRSLVQAADIECISLSTLRSSPFFSKYEFIELRGYSAALGATTAMSQDAWQQLSLKAQFYRFAGMLSNIDVAAACCLLIIEHPNFNSESIQNAVLLNVRGKSRLLITDNNEHSIFYCDKPRAGTLKSATLTARSQMLILNIIRCTAPIREVLRRAGDKTWRYLFIGVSRGVLGVVEGRPGYLHGQSGSLGLASIYPTLTRNGLGLGSFDYRRLRNTMGIIRWFETGSIVELSRKLGNTHKVALEHYLPAALLHAWNTRIIRRFQNTLIALAACDEPYLLEVTDFSNMADLQHFITQMIVDYPRNTSPIGDEVQRRFGPLKSGDASLSTSAPGLLNIHLSPKSLGLLYSYTELALKNLSQDDLDKVDILSGLAPRQFTDVSILLRHAVENNEIHPSLRETLDLPLLAKVHGQALALKIDFDTKFAGLSLKRKWGDNHE